MGKRQISFFIENELWKEFSHKCIEKGTTKTEVLINAVKEFLR